MNSKGGDIIKAMNGSVSGKLPEEALQQRMIESRAEELKDELVYYAREDGARTVAQISADLIPELKRAGTAVACDVTLEQIAGSLKRIGIDHVVSADCAAQEAQSRAEALLDENLGKKPLILSNDPAAWKVLWQDCSALSDHFVFYPAELELFGASARREFSAEKVFVFGVLGPDAAEAAANGDIDIAFTPHELCRILVRTGAEPDAAFACAPERYPVSPVSGKYGKLLEKLNRNLDAEPETITVSADGRELRCALCRNLGQARRAIETIDQYDVIRVIA